MAKRRDERRRWPVRGAILVLTLLSACGSTNPATGRWQPVHVDRIEEEAIGLESHQRFLDRFALAEGAPVGALQAAVERIGGRLAAASERPDLDWRFYILDEDSVNAFAAPGGRIYLTRGLLAFADSEEDVAGVLAHEIGHVTAAHYKDMLALRPTALEDAKTRVRLELGEAAAEMDAEALSRRVEQAALEAIAEVSQRNELEADVLSTRYLAKAGYPARAALDFMKDVIALQAFLDREAAARGAQAGAAVFQSHPLSDRRVAVTEAALANAARIAAAAPPAGEGAIRQHRAAWLRLLDGLPVESDAAGLVRGGRFGWPAQGFRIDAPAGMTLLATLDGAVGSSSDGRTLYLDADRADLFIDTETALDDLRMRLAAVRAEAVFAEDATPIRLGDWTGLRVDIPPSDVKGSTWLSLVTVLGPEGPIRLIYGGESANRGPHLRTMRRLLRSLRPIGAGDAAAFAPLRLAVAPLAEGVTLEQLAAEAPLYDIGAPVRGPKPDLVRDRALALERLRLLNGLAPGEDPAPGALVKRLVR